MIGFFLRIEILKVRFTVPVKLRDVEANQTFSLGSRIASVTIVDNTGQTIPYIHDYPFNFTYPILQVSI